MKRLVEQKLISWAQSAERKPLIVRGARQVGKTYVIEQFAEQTFPGALATLDLELRRDCHGIFEGNLDPKQILPKIEAAIKQRIIPGKTLLFLDEAQACPRSITALRYFYEKMPELHVIAAGSLLDMAFKEISMPVGRVQFLYVHPLNFEEFLMALGESFMHKIWQGPVREIVDTAHEQLREILRSYLFVGGMPAVVAKFIENRSVLEAQEIQKEIVQTYRSDFAKYKPKVDLECLNEVFLNSAKRLGKVLKYSQLAGDFSNPTIKKAFSLLQEARVLYKVKASSAQGLPLGASAREKIFKAIFVDLSFVHQLCDWPVDALASQENLLSLYQGVLAEQFIGQELVALLDNAPYFWQREQKTSQAEVDYLISLRGNILPIEVKSGPAGRLKSLHLLLKENPHVQQGYILADTMFGQIPEQKLSFMPLYSLAKIGDGVH